jgi:anti-sigma B factor antagonist
MADYSTRQKDDVTILRLAGRLNGPDCAAELHRNVADLVRDGNRKILLDCGELSYMDSSGIGAFVSDHLKT